MCCYGMVYLILILECSVPHCRRLTYKKFMNEENMQESTKSCALSSKTYRVSSTITVEVAHVTIPVTMPFLVSFTATMSG